MVWLRGRAKGLVLVSDLITYYLRVVLDTDFFFSCYIFGVSGPASGEIALSRNKEVGHYLNVDNLLSLVNFNNITKQSKLTLGLENM